MKEKIKIEQTCPSGSFAYTIKSGDTLYKLAITYGTTVEAIMAINPGINPNNLQIGQVICIPRGTTPPMTCPTGSFPYTIKSGDTLYLLAIRYNTTVEAIMAINPGINPNNLQIGQVICIPQSTPGPTRCPMGSFAYTIKQGDTLYMLAIRYNTTVEAIMMINPGIDPNNLQIGQVICIPETTPPPPRCPMGSFAYTIKAGDTLYDLAIRYNTTVMAIMAINPGIDPNNLRIGQVICIPETTPPPPKCPMGSFAYTIKPGDTLYMLAIEYDTTVKAIMDLNPGIDPNNLRVGQVICIPEHKPIPCEDYYVVRAGDTFYSIAMKYGVTVAELMKANPGVDPNNLRIGQILCIPKGDMPKPCPGGTMYVVKSTDSLSSILVRFNISIMDLEAGNPGIDVDRLRVGQELCILPHRDRGCPCGRDTTPYTIVPADVPASGSALNNLANKFNVTVSSILKANPNMAPSDFVAGKRVCIPD